MLSYIMYFLYTDLQNWEAAVALKVAVKCWIHAHHKWQVTLRLKPGHAGVQKNQVAWSGMPQHLLLDVQKGIIMSLSRESYDRHLPHNCFFTGSPPLFMLCLVSITICHISFYSTNYQNHRQNFHLLGIMYKQGSFCLLSHFTIFHNKLWFCIPC